MRILLLFIGLISTSAFAQDLVLVSKVTDDSIAIKWLPNNFEQLELITNGTTISRVISDKPTNYESVDFTNAKTWDIAPTEVRIENLGSSEEDEKFKALLDPILNRTTDKEQQNFAMLTATVENMVNPRFQIYLGNIFVDTDFDKRKTYIYKIEIENLAPSYIYVDAYQNTFYSEIPEFELNLDRKRTVMIEWNSNAIQKESLGFLIEHSMDKKREGTYLNELPHIPFKSQFEADDKKANVIDNPEQGHWHYYRVHGLDPFGHPNLVSEWKSIYVPLLVNAHVQIDTIIAKASQREIRVSAASITGITQIDTWKLLRSEQKDSGYTIVGTKPYSDSLANFSVNGKPSGDHFYYKIQAINKDDTVASLPYYFFTLDQVPPVAPTQLDGSIDSSGIVRLNWTASIDDDIRGYKVFRGNQKREEFTEQTTRLSTNLSFVDTLALDNLTSEVYYYLQAVDLNFNVSSQSDTILLLKPDTIPPMAAALKSAKMVDTSIVIVWANSDSQDLAQTILIRNHSDTIPLQVGQTKYIDFDLIPAKHYSYQILTKDKSKNQSYSQEVGQYYETGYRKALSGFMVTVDREQNHISVSWKVPPEDVFSYQLYRSRNDGKLGLIKTINDPKELQFTDKQLSIGTKYTYSINYVNQQGIHSLPASGEVIY
jgi:hypothetical protein